MGLRDAVPGNTIRTSLMNFTNPDTGGGYPSQGCAVNGVPYGESIPYQELLNVTQEFNLVWVSVHSFHHHISPCAPRPAARAACEPAVRV